MTKIKLEIELDIPQIENYSDAELGQLLFDEYINHATCAHNEAALRWMCKKEITSAGKTGKNMIIKMHQTWAEICDKAKWSFKKIE